MEENTQLPVEVVEEIKQKAEEFANSHVNGRSHPELWEIVFKANEAGATAYATKLHQANETIKVLTYDNNRLKGEVEGYKSALDELRTKYDNILATESGHESKTENVWQSGYAAGHETGCEQGKRDAQPGAVWVKASEFKYEVGMAYHAKDSKSKGAGSFDDFGNFFWGDGSFTAGENQDDLLVLDESPAARREEEQVLVFTPCMEDDPGYCGAYTSNCGRSLCFVKEIQVPLSAIKQQKEK